MFILSKVTFDLFFFCSYVKKKKKVDLCPMQLELVYRMTNNFFVWVSSNILEDAYPYFDHVNCEAKVSNSLTPITKY